MEKKSKAPSVPTIEEWVSVGLENPGYVDSLLEELKRSSVREHRFDFNFSLADGKVAEALVEQLISGELSVEVKRDNRVSDTGNVLVEYAHSGKPSGITTSESKYWAFVLSGDKYRSEVIIFITLDRLRQLVNLHGKSNALSGIPGNSNFILIPVEKLLERNVGYDSKTGTKGTQTEATAT